MRRNGLLFALALIPAAAFGAEDFVRTDKGCLVKPVNAEWAETVVTGVTWTGACVRRAPKDKKDKATLAEGEGVLTLALRDGRAIRFQGRLAEGRMQRGEQLEADGRRFVGSYNRALNVRFGQLYRPDGSLEFDGQMNQHQGGFGFRHGIAYSADGRLAAEGHFLVTAPEYDVATGKGQMATVVYDRAGAVVKHYTYEFEGDAEGYAGAKAQLDRNLKMMADFDAQSEAFFADMKRADAEMAQRRAQDRAYMWNAFGAALGAAATGGSDQERLANANAALQQQTAKSVAEGAQGSVAGAMVKGAMGASLAGTGGTSPKSRVREVPRGSVRFDPASNASDESKCLRVVIEETGTTSLVDGVHEPDVWVLLINQCGYDVQAGYCFEVNQSGYSCATAYRDGPKPAQSRVYVADANTRQNARFNGDRTHLLSPLQRVFLGACRIANAPGQREVVLQHEFEQGAFTFRCTQN